jgi:hypothetical protein
MALFICAPLHPGQHDADERRTLFVLGLDQLRNGLDAELVG